MDFTLQDVTQIFKEINGQKVASIRHRSRQKQINMCSSEQDAALQLLHFPRGPHPVPELIVGTGARGAGGLRDKIVDYNVKHLKL